MFFGGGEYSLATLGEGQCPFWFPPRGQKGHRPRIMFFGGGEYSLATLGEGRCPFLMPPRGQKGHRPRIMFLVVNTQKTCKLTAIKLKGKGRQLANGGNNEIINNINYLPRCCIEEVSWSMKKLSTKHCMSMKKKCVNLGSALLCWESFDVERLGSRRSAPFWLADRPLGETAGTIKLI